MNIYSIFVFSHALDRPHAKCYNKNVDIIIIRKEPFAMKYDPSIYPACTVPASDIQQVKGLGFLRDKTTSDCFNARVITRNGRITADEMYAIADAARRYGKDEVAFTTRQTV